MPDTHVVLAANAAEGWDEECGWVLHTARNGMLIVGLCRSDLEPGDDGMRDVTPDQVVKTESAIEVDKLA